MKRTVIVFASVLTAFSAVVSCSRYESVASDPLNTRIYTLSNGLQVYMTVNRTEPRIQTYIAVKVGSKNDPSETTGLAHYFEHLMFKGSEQFGTSDYSAEKPMLDAIEQLFETYRKTADETERKAIYRQIDSISYEASKLAIPNEYDKLMALIGADGTNAWTSSDGTVYTEDIPSNQIDNWARIQADRFRNTVIRGFHTELETIYEEKNMSLTQDSRKIWEALDQALFPNHPYGQQTTLGTQEHLKNPSITNVRKYHDTYYVPNNIRICLSGDFNPDEMVSVIEKYFGDWEPNPDIPVLEYEKEQPIASPVIKEVYGLEVEMLAMGWRLPGSSDVRMSAVATIAEAVLSNGMCGLIDLDVNQRQRALSLGAGFNGQSDYSSFIAMGRPKQGQTLEDLRDIVLEEIAKLRSGDFDGSLIPSSVNNARLEQMRSFEKNSSRAVQYVDAFINGIDWKDAVNRLDYLSEVTKEDVVKFANEYLGEECSATVYKRQGKDGNVRKISAPAITPIVTNRDARSAFFDEISAKAVKPVDPVFVDFRKDMSVYKYDRGPQILYVKNDVNDIFDISFVFNSGVEDNPALNIACDYINYLGTPMFSAEEIAGKMYELGCNFSIYAGANTTTVNVNGLSENMSKAVVIVENLILRARPDEDILKGVKMDILKSRENSKSRQRDCFNALARYVRYGPEFIRRTTLDNSAIEAITSEELLRGLRELFAKGHEIQYYGPLGGRKLQKVLPEFHTMTEGARPLPELFTQRLKTEKSEVVLSQYDAKQLYYGQYSNRGEKFNPSEESRFDLYNEYFGGGMNAIVLQEMREARGLAYSAWAGFDVPSYADDDYSFTAFIATQNDKLRTAVGAFDEIINDMPLSEAAFSVAKEALIGRLRTQRTTGKDIIRSYCACRRLGIDRPLAQQVLTEIRNMSLSDVDAFQKEWVKDRNYTYAILGDIKDLDSDFLSTLGPVRTASLEDIFGF